MSERRAGEQITLIDPQNLAADPGGRLQDHAAGTQIIERLGGGV